MRWVGIDEAGYGPNLGPLVMTAVIAEAESELPEAGRSRGKATPDLWRDLAATVSRAGGDASRCWVDDSKALLRFRHGRERLQAACLALLEGGCPGDLDSRGGLLAAVGTDLAAAELDRWSSNGWAESPWPEEAVLRFRRGWAEDPFRPPDRGWRIRAVRSVMLGPEEFNRRLARSASKAVVHFSVFRSLLEAIWELAVDGLPTRVRCDKHGGRHYYYEQLIESFPGCWIDRGPEGPALSRYQIRDETRTMGIALSPRADSRDGFVALASMVSKTLREVWMEAFNGFWIEHLPLLRPTAGYPGDSLRFRHLIEPTAKKLGLDPSLWWRAR